MLKLEYNFFVEKFGVKDNIMIIGVDSENFFDINNFKHWQNFGDSLKTIDGVENVYSITDVVNLSKSKREKKLVINSIFENINTQNLLDDAVLQLNKLPFYKERLFNDR